MAYKISQLPDLSAGSYPRTENRATSGDVFEISSLSAVGGSDIFNSKKIEFIDLAKSIADELKKAPKVDVFDTAGTINYTVVEGYTNLKIIATGAGADLTYSTTVNPGYDTHCTGGAGATVIKYINANVGDTLSGVVGQTDNTDTTFTYNGTTYTAGKAYTTIAPAASGGYGGIASGGDINIRGGHGRVDIDDSEGREEGQGGSSYWGNSPAWGGGASGTRSTIINPAIDGVIIIEAT